MRYKGLIVVKTDECSATTLATSWMWEPSWRGALAPAHMLFMNVPSLVVSNLPAHRPEELGAGRGQVNRAPFAHTAARRRRGGD